MEEIKIKSNYQGSETTREMVLKQIEQRFGVEASKGYDPYNNCLLFSQWKKAGFVVKKGERSLKSVVVIKKKDKDGLIKKYPKTIHLFFHPQVEKITN